MAKPLSIDLRERIIDAIMINRLLNKIKNAQKKHSKLIEEELNILSSGKKLPEQKLINACKKTEKISSEIRLLKAELYKSILGTIDNSDLIISTISEKEFSQISYNERVKICALFDYYDKLGISYDKSTLLEKIMSIYFYDKCSLDEILASSAKSVG